MTQVHHEITGITIHVCMVATGQLVLCIATVAKLTTRALKNTIYSNFRACTLAGPDIQAQIQHYAWQLVQHYTSWLLPYAQGQYKHRIQLYIIKFTKVPDIYNTCHIEYMQTHYSNRQVIYISLCILYFSSYSESPQKTT